MTLCCDFYPQSKQITIYDGTSGRDNDIIPLLTLNLIFNYFLVLTKLFAFDEIIFYSLRPNAFR